MAARLRQQIADLTAAVRQQTTVINSVKTLIEGLKLSKGELDEAGETEASAALDMVIAEFTANAQALADAVIQNTPAEGEGTAAETPPA